MTTLRCDLIVFSIWFLCSISPIKYGLSVKRKILYKFILFFCLYYMHTYKQTYIFSQNKSSLPLCQSASLAFSRTVGPTYILILTPNDSLKNLFLAILFNLRFFFFCQVWTEKQQLFIKDSLTWDLKSGLYLCKPAHYLLDDGDFFWFFLSLFNYQCCLYSYINTKRTKLRRNSYKKLTFNNRFQTFFFIEIFLYFQGFWRWLHSKYLTHELKFSNPTDKLLQHTNFDFAILHTSQKITHGNEPIALLTQFWQLVLKNFVNNF